MFEVSLLPKGLNSSLQARKWAEDRFNRALLLIADSTEPLLPYSRFWAVSRPASPDILGLAVRFEGFRQTVVSYAADNSDAACELLRVACNNSSDAKTIIAVSADQELPDAFRSIPIDTIDTWLTATCLSESIAQREEVETLSDANSEEIDAFYLQQGMHFWCPAMLRTGHYFGIRDVNGKLVCAAGVNFILASQSYAQIGALVTHPDYRGRSYASQVLQAIRLSLSRAGVRECGLFADGANPDLPAFYSRRGFEARGKIRFIEHSGAHNINV
ncbi:MAG TPA: GNAT family N-acetyltransferase [Blastocatellia bacterium]|nr:GNAT family N-acetyltransferase [Blastocatellia bacterium]